MALGAAVAVGDELGEAVACRRDVGGQVFTERPLRRIDRRWEVGAAALCFRRPALIAPTLGIGGDVWIDGRRTVWVRAIPRQGRCRVQRIPRVDRWPVDTASDATQPARSLLVRSGISQSLDGAVAPELVAVTMDQPMELAQRHLTVSSNDPDQHLPQLDPDQHVGIHRRRRQHSLVDPSGSPYVSAVRLRPEARPQRRHAVQDGSATSGEDFQLGVDRREFVGVGAVGESHEADVVRPQPRLVGTHAGEERWVQIGCIEHGDDGTDAC